jgi:hypothetical protein
MRFTIAAAIAFIAFATAPAFSAPTPMPRGGVSSGSRRHQHRRHLEYHRVENVAAQKRDLQRRQPWSALQKGKAPAKVPKGPRPMPAAQPSPKRPAPKGPRPMPAASVGTKPLRPLPRPPTSRKRELGDIDELD